jgi:hypothetical protein
MLPTLMDLLDGMDRDAARVERDKKHFSYGAHHHGVNSGRADVGMPEHHVELESAQRAEPHLYEERLF